LGGSGASRDAQTSDAARDAAVPDAKVDAPIDARVDAPIDATRPLGAVCGEFIDGGIVASDECDLGLGCCPVCCHSPTAVCAQPASNDAGIGVGECPLPDLQVDLTTLASEITLGEQDFTADSCEIMEGCIASAGTRRLLGFSVKTPNLGTADLDFGDPANNPAFVFSPCHGHYHLRGYASYRLLDANGATVVTGRKQAFCLLDLERQDFPLGSPSGRFSCDNQGISVGWADIYTNGLPCQYLDVTDVPPGNYTLEVTINPDHIFPELDYSNNTARTPVRLTMVSTDPLSPCDTTQIGAERDCGWTDGPTFSCTAGAQVTLGCGASCGLGTCLGDTVLRVCAGPDACRHAAALAENDDCMNGTYCSSASFLCPATGQYHAMTGAWNSAESATCTLAHSP
jgi:hypothetical protein